MQPLKVHLHQISRNGQRVDVAVGRAVRDAADQHIPLVEIIAGRSGGELRQHALRFLDRPHMRYYCDHVETGPRNRGAIRVFVRA